MMPKKLKTIISDESIALKSAISQLIRDGIFDGVHLLDLYHVLKNIRKRLTNAKQLRLFSDLAK
jgi:hypothetical protein